MGNIGDKGVHVREDGLGASAALKRGLADAHFRVWDGGIGQAFASKKGLLAIISHGCIISLNNSNKKNVGVNSEILGAKGTS